MSVRKEFEEWWATIEPEKGSPLWYAQLRCVSLDDAFAIYEAAYKAGTERAAVICDDMHLYTGYDCAAAIRKDAKDE